MAFYYFIHQCSVPYENPFKWHYNPNQKTISICGDCKNLNNFFIEQNEFLRYYRFIESMATTQLRIYFSYVSILFADFQIENGHKIMKRKKITTRH